MDIDRDILLAKAAEGSLTPAEQRQWEALCTAEPELRAKAEEAKAMLARLARQVPAPAELAPGLFERLELARRQTFGNSKPVPARRPDRRAPGESRGWFPAPVAWALAALSALAIAGGGALWMRSSFHPQRDLVAMKELGMDPKLPVVAPGAWTAFTDPSVFWFSLDPSPVEVAVLDASGRTVLGRVEGSRPPLSWDQLGAGRMAPATAFRIRVSRNGTGPVSERLVRVDANARPLAIEMADARAATAHARELLAAGRPADALILATALAKAHPERAGEWIELRSEALKAALRAVAKEGNPGT